MQTADNAGQWDSDANMLDMLAHSRQKTQRQQKRKYEMFTFRFAVVTDDVKQFAIQKMTACSCC